MEPPPTPHNSLNLKAGGCRTTPVNPGTLVVIIKLKKSPRLFTSELRPHPISQLAFFAMITKLNAVAPPQVLICDEPCKPKL